MERLLGFKFGHRVMILGQRNIRLCKFSPPNSRFPIDLDRTGENQALNPSRYGLSSEILRSRNIHFTKRCQRVGGKIVHHMHAGSEMDDGIDTLQSGEPISSRIDTANRMDIRLCNRSTRSTLHNVTLRSSLTAYKQPNEATSTCD